MTAAISRPSADFTVPPSQNTAPVVEFRCLYTHDLRRKQKRWQDGLLRFHTFNKRIMVYDPNGGHIGDKHWKKDADLQEGEELTLDRGVMVEVEDVITTTYTDVSELTHKRRKSPAKQTREDAPMSSSPLVSRHPAAAVATPPKHKSLSALLGSRRGTYGKATLQSKSPYQLRLEDKENSQDGQYASKRRKIGHASSMAKTAVPSWRTRVDESEEPASKQTYKKPSTTGHAIDLTSSMEDFPSDVTLPPTPPTVRLSTNTTWAHDKRPLQNSVQAPRLVQPTAPRPAVIPPEEVISDRSTLGAPRGEQRDKDALDDGREPQPSQLRQPTAVNKNTQTKALRIVKASPRRMLLCASKDSSSQPPSRVGPDHNARVVSNAPTPRNNRRSNQAKDESTEIGSASLDSPLDLSDEEAAVKSHVPSHSSKPQTPQTGQDGNRPQARKIARAPSAEGIMSLLKAVSNDSAQPSRRSPLKKAKSLSTTDVGDGAAANKSKESKGANITSKKGVATARACTEKADIGPWSTEAFDLFDWHPPGRDILSRKDVTGVA